MRNWSGTVLGMVAAGVLSGLIGLGAASRTANAQAPSLRDGYRRPSGIPFPASNPYTPEKAALGKALFFEPRLSGAEDMTCSSCHNPQSTASVQEFHDQAAVRARLVSQFRLGSSHG